MKNIELQPTIASSRSETQGAAREDAARERVSDEAAVIEDVASAEVGSAGIGEESGTGETETAAAEGLSALQVVGSMLAAGLGVQSSKNRERDFKQGRAGVFIAAGLVFTALFIGAVYTVVSLVLSTR